MSVYLNENKFTIVLNDIGLGFLTDPDAPGFQYYVKDLGEKGFAPYESVIFYIVTNKSQDELPDYLRTKVKDVTKCYVIEIPSHSDSTPKEESCLQESRT
jgi:hypothetical protein